MAVPRFNKKVLSCLALFKMLPLVVAFCTYQILRFFEINRDPTRRTTAEIDIHQANADCYEL